MNTEDAIAIIIAYGTQGRLNGAQRRLLMMARKVVWERAETIRKNAEE